MRLRNFSHVSRQIHIFTYMLRQCTCIVFILQFYIVNKHLLDNNKSIWNNFVYVFENNIPRCAPMWAELTFVCFDQQHYLIIYNMQSATIYVYLQYTISENIILSTIYDFIRQWQHLPTNIACPIYFFILVSYK
jgi:hypothetical protein